MENINCSYNSENGNYTCEIPYIDALSYNGENTYYFNYWTAGEVIIAFLLFFILMWDLIKYGFEFFFPKLVRIQRNKKL